jgi:hypothetical protein
VFSGKDGSLLQSFFAYAPGFAGGVRVAAGDVTGDRKADVVTGAGPGGGPQVNVFDGANPGRVLQSFMAYAPSFAGGVYVAAGDVSGDGKADIVTGAGAGGGPQVNVFNGANRAVIASFFAYAPSFTGGVRVGVVLDVSGDGLPDVLTAAGPGGGPHTRVFSGTSAAAVEGFFAYDPAFLGGVFVGGL